jgi:cyclic dehypoxanthinyl futalosine synthase
MNNKELTDKIISGARIDSHEALELFRWNILELGALADIRRRMIHPENTVGFILDRIINFTNVCEAKCRFCAYHACAGSVPSYDMSVEEVLAKVGELAAAGGSQVMLQGGMSPDYDRERYMAQVRAVKEEHPAIYLHPFSPSEIHHMSRRAGLSLDDVLAKLKEAGCDSVPGASDLLVDRMRRSVSPNKISVSQWCDVMDALHRNGMKSSATMTYGMGETLEERVQHLDVIRQVQDRTHIIRAFIPWSFSPKNTELADMIPAGAHDYLKIVSIGRIYLDNVRYIQAGWLTEGLKLAQTVLAMGANDMGGVLTEELVVKATGITTKGGMDDFVELIRNAGFTPVLRDSDYRILKTL